MLHSIDQFRRHTIQASDGDIGSVVDVWFDDEFWTIRYLVVDTGGWLSGRKVLLIPSVLGKADWKTNRLPVQLTRKQVQESPGIDSDRPVSRQYEIELNAHYGWPAYWGGTEPLPTGMQPSVPMPPLRSQPSGAFRKEPGDRHLRSMRELQNYRIHAVDGEIGHVDDFLVDDEQWDVRYLVVATRNWLPGRKVLISPRWLVGEISWARQAVNLIMNRESIRCSPEYDPSAPPDRAYENELEEHYRRAGFGGEDQTRKAA